MRTSATAPSVATEDRPAMDGSICAAPGTTPPVAPAITTAQRRGTAQSSLPMPMAPRGGSEMKCDFMDVEGRCRGPYDGFGCIKEKCLSRRKANCEFNDHGFYCLKYRRFECIGIANCSTLDDYLNFVNERRRRAHESK
jgi:hypothetical protein